mgnify:CR=1 FL=1
MKKRIEYEQITSLDPDWVREQIAHFMEEDIPDGDVTTKATITESAPIIANMVAAEPFVFCGESIIPYCFPEPCLVDVKKKDGEWVQSGNTLAIITGPAGPILTYERVTLNLIQRLCGISTETKKYCDLDLPDHFKVMDTRKQRRDSENLKNILYPSVAVGIIGWI